MYMRRYAGWIECARAFQVGCVDFEGVVAAVAVGVDPLANRVARDHMFGQSRPSA
jgi:hypothetical protein